MILAAGAVVWRKRRSSVGGDSGAVDVLVVHRPKYDDWSFPKGKLDQSELGPVAAVREVHEETGLRVRLGVPLTTLQYPLSSPRGATKAVTYWAARHVSGPPVEDFVANREVDQVRWVRSSKASGLLTYDRERTVLAAFESARATGAHRSRTLVVLRHATAVRRGDWDRDDLQRPLAAAGRKEAAAVAPLLDAWGVRRIVSSEAARCVQTVEPYADSLGTYIVLDQRLNEQRGEGRQPGPEPVFHAMDELLDQKRPAVACGHRPILPWMFDAVGAKDPQLETGQLAVVHHRRGDVFAVEVHPANCS